MWGRGAPGGAVPKIRQRRTPGTPPTGEEEVGEEARDRGGVSGGGGREGREEVEQTVQEGGGT